TMLMVTPSTWHAVEGVANSSGGRLAPLKPAPPHGSKKSQAMAKSRTATFAIAASVSPRLWRERGLVVRRASSKKTGLGRGEELAAGIVAVALLGCAGLLSA